MGVFFDKMTAIADGIRGSLGIGGKMGLVRMVELLPEALDVEYDNGYKEGADEKKDFLLSVLNRTVTEVNADDLIGLNKIGRNAFRGCHEMTSMEIPEGVYTLQAGALRDCQNLSSIKLPTTLEVVDTNAIDELPLVNELTLYQNMRFISKNALRPGSTENKATITFYNKTPPTIQADTFNENTLDKILVLFGSYEAYKTATNWVLVSHKLMFIEDSVSRTAWYVGNIKFGDGTDDTAESFELSFQGDLPVGGRYLILNIQNDGDERVTLDGYAVADSYVARGEELEDGRDLIIDLGDDFSEEFLTDCEGAMTPFRFVFSTSQTNWDSPIVSYGLSVCLAEEVATE